jgi:hypothetical protein
MLDTWSVECPDQARPAESSKKKRPVDGLQKCPREIHRVQIIMLSSGRTEVDLKSNRKLWSLHYLLWRAVCSLQGLTGRELAGLYSCGLRCGVRERTKSTAGVRISVSTS